MRKYRNDNLLAVTLLKDIIDIIHGCVCVSLSRQISRAIARNWRKRCALISTCITELRNGLNWIALRKYAGLKNHGTNIRASALRLATVEAASVG